MKTLRRRISQTAPPVPTPKNFCSAKATTIASLLQMVDTALLRIREGSFGECIHCGKEINSKRLEAVPWTRHCIECQEKLEQGLLEETSR